MGRTLATFLATAALACAGALGAAGAEQGGENREIRSIPEFSADYELRRNNTRAAILTRTLSCDGANCSFTSEGETTGIIDLLLRGSIQERTRFRLTQDGLQPRDYRYRQRARGDNDENVRLFFGRNGRVTSRGDDEWETTVDTETMDELLSQLRLMLAVRDGETEMEFDVVEGDGDLDTYRFAVTGTETVDTAGAGSFEAVKVERVGGSDSRRTEMWFAPELEYMPVIVRHERVGRETYTATLKELKQAPGS